MHKLTFIDWRENYIVVNELTPLHDHQGVAYVRCRHIIVHVSGDQARRRERPADLGGRAGFGETWRSRRSSIRREHTEVTEKMKSILFGNKIMNLKIKL